MKFIGLNAGQFGDLVMNTVAARAIKQKWPESHFTLGIGQPFKEIAPLFKNHPYIDDVHIWESYDGLTDQDKYYIEENEFDKVFNPMPQHKHSDWYNRVKNQTEEVCLMHDLIPPDDLSCYLEKYFKPFGIGRDVVCISPWTAHEPKNLPLEKWEKIVKYIKGKGYDVAQLSAPNQPAIYGAWRSKIATSYMSSVNTLLASKLLITLDSGMSWTASAYQHPVLGLYGYHYPSIKSPKVYEPINSNAIYLEGQHANDIPLEQIFDQIDKML